MGNFTDSAPNINAIRDAYTRVIRQIDGYLRREKTTICEIISNPFIISKQIFRTYDAIDLLIREAFISEARLLVLIQFELRVDLAYSVYDSYNATRWPEHENLEWNVAQTMEKKINTIFSQRDDRSRIIDIFNYLSSIKHCNSISAGMDFPARGCVHGLLIPTGGLEDDSSNEFARQLARYAMYLLAWSFQTLSFCAGQYAIVDWGLRSATYELFSTLQANEEEFRQYLAHSARQNHGPFGLKGRAMPSSG